jgi:hypothetical protein
MRVLHAVSTSFLVLFCLGSVAATEAPDVEEIVRQANLAAFYGGADGRAETRMTIVDAQGREQVRQFTILRRDVEDGGDQQFLVLFSYPADVRKTVFLVHKHVGAADDDRWLYLPDLDLVKRIAAGDKRTSFVGSHFFYEDVSGRALDEDEHVLVETTDEHYVVRNVPRDPKSVEFSEYTVWIDRSNWMPVRTEYKDATGEVYRRVEALEIERIDGHPTATRMKVSDLARNAHTINEMRFIHYDVGLPEQIFTERSLRNPPREWFRRPEK